VVTLALIPFEVPRATKLAEVEARTEGSVPPADQVLTVVASFDGSVPPDDQVVVVLATLAFSVPAVESEFDVPGRRAAREPPVCVVVPGL
jgi:hypothetical protein